MENQIFETVLRAYPEAVQLKAGGQKVVYRINHPKYGPSVLKLGMLFSPQTRKRMVREVEILRQLDSNYYPRQYKFEFLDDDGFMMIEEYVPSQPLSECLTRFSVPADATKFALELVEGLSLLWDKKIVHRDIKPDNILVLPDNRPKIIDLGIARSLNEESLTHTMAQRGPCTPAYAAPEQLKNRKAAIDFRTDQFSLGLVFGQLLLSGKHLFDPRVIGTGETVWQNILSGSWAKDLLRARVPAEIYGVVDRLLEKEPHGRYRKQETLVADLKRSLGACS